MIRKDLLIPFFIIILLISPFLLSASDLPPEAERGESIFLNKCISCHTIGKGKLLGPDLLGITERRNLSWLEEFIYDPQKLFDKRDPVAVGLLEEYKIRMPSMGLSIDEVRLVISFLSNIKRSIGPVEEKETLSGGNPERGKALFTGKTPFNKGGLPCIACHNTKGLPVAGGILGPDLTASLKAFGKDALRSALTKIQFPTMEPLYATKPLTADEIADLIAFLESISEKDTMPAFGKGALFITGGVLLIFGLIQISWRGRLRDVRKNIIHTASKK